jgi:UDP-glucuronate 4-epimerase
MKKIIITGCSGFIGSALVEYLFKNLDDIELYGIDRLDADPHIRDKCSTFYKQDINDPLPDITDVWTVIHLAGKASVRDSEEKFDQIIHDNINGTHSIIRKCIDVWKPQKLIIASSSSVYGDIPDGYKTLIDTFPDPKSPYALSKLMIEKMVNIYRSQLKEIALLRIFTVYGANQRKGLAIREFITSALEDKPLIVYGDGTQARDFTYIIDICEAIRLMIELPIPHRIYNLGSENSLTISEVIYKISRYLGKPLTIDYQPEIPYDVNLTLSDSSLMTKDFNWKPLTSFDDGLREEIEWCKIKLEIEKIGKDEVPTTV